MPTTVKPFLPDTLVIGNPHQSESLGKHGLYIRVIACPVAQLVEHWARILKVVGSIPTMVGHVHQPSQCVINSVTQQALFPSLS